MNVSKYMALKHFAIKNSQAMSQISDTNECINNASKNGRAQVLHTFHISLVLFLILSFNHVAKKKNNLK